MDFIPLSSKHTNITSQIFPSIRKRDFNKMSSNVGNNSQSNGSVANKSNKRTYDSKLKSRIKTKAKGMVSYLFIQFTYLFQFNIKSCHP